MKIQTDIDKALNDELLKIKDSSKFVNFIFNYCESQEDRKKLLSYILNGNNDRKDVLLMASQIGIESGTVEGELEEV
jgi:hypothetical protein